MNEPDGRTLQDSPTPPSAPRARVGRVLGDWRAVVVGSVQSWMDHRAGSKGAALAFYALFSMVPILILAIAGAGYVFGAEAARGDVMAQIEGLVGPTSARTIQ